MLVLQCLSQAKKTSLNYSELKQKLGFEILDQDLESVIEDLHARGLVLAHPQSRHWKDPKYDKIHIRGPGKELIRDL